MAIKATIKGVAKRVVPASVRGWLRETAGRLDGWRQVVAQTRRFNRCYAKAGRRGGMQVEARLIFFAHQIEKGLSHLRFRYGFGHGALTDLAGAMRAYREVNPRWRDAVPYRSAVAALHEYVVRHEGHDADLRYVRGLFADEWESIVAEPELDGGSIVLPADAKAGNAALTFRELSEHRHSLREYADRPVTGDELEAAVELAMRAPSVCNRQPTRVHIILDPDLIRRALAVQGGFNGYAPPPALLLITADNRVFMSMQERNEGFTDGGLFAMNLLLALEEERLAACPLNTMFTRGAETRTRSLLGLPDHENLVMYIAVGHYPDVMRTCVSHRLPASAIITTH